MRKVIALALVLMIGVALLAACGGPSLKGTFVNPDDSGDYIVLKSGGKATVHSGSIDFSGKYTVEGDKLVVTISFLGIESDTDYIISDNETKLIEQTWMETVYIKK